MMEISEVIDSDLSSSASVGSTNTESNLVFEEHRPLNQPFNSPSDSSSYESVDNLDDGLQYDDAEEDYDGGDDGDGDGSDGDGSDGDGSDGDDSDGDDDGHFLLNQSPLDNTSCGDYELELSDHNDLQPIKRFCLQCHAWPELEDCKDLRNECHHTSTDPLESAFGESVYYTTLSQSFVIENPATATRRKVMESVLKVQFYLLIQQFAVNLEKVAHLLYGVAVIDINDLEIATSWTLTVLDRAKILTITLVRRLRRWPDLFGDVCKVLSDIPAVQEANAKVRQILYEECSEDQYSKLLTKNVQHHHQSIEDIHNSIHNLSSMNEEDRSHDITEDSMSHTSTMSEDGGNDHCSSKSKVTLLHESCLETRSIRSLDALIDGKIDINSRDQNERTPLIIACLCLPSEIPNPKITSKQRKKIRCLLKNGADSTIQDHDGNTALHIATLRQDQEVVKLLLNKVFIKENFNLAITNINSRTALHYACYWGNVDLVLPLLELERDVKSGLLDVCDKNGDTGLHIASRRGFKAIVRELLKENARKDIKNEEGKTAADVATEAKHNRIAKLIRKKKFQQQFVEKKIPVDEIDCGIQRSGSPASLLSTESRQLESRVSDDEMFHLDMEGKNIEIEYEQQK